MLNGKVSDDWYKKPVEESQYAKEMPLDAEGNLKKTAEDDESSDPENEESEKVTRDDVKAFYADMVRDELQVNFHVCNIEGNLHELRHNDTWKDDGPSSDDSSEELSED